MRTMTLEGFIRHLQRVRAELPRAEAEGVRAAAQVIHKEAQRLIGRENNEWKRLAASTVKQKQRLGYTGRVSATDPLLRRGGLRASIEWSASGRQAHIGTNDKVAVFQEFGTSRIPARPFIATAAFRKGADAARLAGRHVAYALAGKRT